MLAGIRIFGAEGLPTGDAGRGHLRGRTTPEETAPRVGQLCDGSFCFGRLPFMGWLEQSEGLRVLASARTPGLKSETWATRPPATRYRKTVHRGSSTCNDCRTAPGWRRSRERLKNRLTKCPICGNMAT